MCPVSRPRFYLSLFRLFPFSIREFLFVYNVLNDRQTEPSSIVKAVSKGEAGRTAWRHGVGEDARAEGHPVVPAVEVALRRRRPPSPAALQAGPLGDVEGDRLEGGGARVKVGLGGSLGFALLPPWLTGGELE